MTALNYAQEYQRSLEQAFPYIMRWAEMEW